MCHRIGGFGRAIGPGFGLYFFNDFKGRKRQNPMATASCRRIGGWACRRIGGFGRAIGLGFGLHFV